MPRDVLSLQELNDPGGGVKDVRGNALLVKLAKLFIAGSLGEIRQENGNGTGTGSGTLVERRSTADNMTVTRADTGNERGAMSSGGHGLVTREGTGKEIIGTVNGIGVRADGSENGIESGTGTGTEIEASKRMVTIAIV